MKDDYLWDGSGEPDPEVQKLEAALGRYRHNQPPPAFEQLVAVAAKPAWWYRFGWPPLRFAAFAGTLLLTVAASYVLSRGLPHASSGPAWDVTALAGKPSVGWLTFDSHTIEAGTGLQKLKVGQTLVTDGSSRASITFDDTGRVDVDPESRLRLVSNDPERKQLSLDRGTIHAVIWAPPGQFAVATPSAVAVDLGCVYTLHVDDSGAGLVRTTTGWVGFKSNNRESFIPAGAVCATRPRIGPGTPYFEDASASFRDALSKFDFDSAPTPAERDTLLRTLLAEAREQDALTLWHLLSRVSDARRADVYDRLAALAPPPGSVSRDGILRLDQRMLDIWWNALGYGDIGLWRMYENNWPDRLATK